MLLGIDVGGTHTDAVLVGRDGIVAWAKAKTRHGDLLASIREVLGMVLAKSRVADVERLNLSTTLSTNAIVEGRTEPVGLFVCAGPGIDPRTYAVGDQFHVIPGSIDHRGRITAPLDGPAAQAALAACRANGVRAYAAVAKFSPRNPDFELSLKEMLHRQADFVSLGHEFTGQLGFPRRIHTAYWNAAVWRVFNRFADAVRHAAVELGLSGQVNILKADGGTMPLAMSRHTPVESILSGPAASVMGIIAVCDISRDSVILDIGGTTTDIAVFADGAPLIEAGGAVIADRPTLVRSLQSRSIGIGGDSALAVDGGDVLVGPRRLGPALAEGGGVPTLVDALNVLGTASVGDTDASAKGLAALAAEHGLALRDLADRAVRTAARTIRDAVVRLVREINNRPVYTIYELLEGKRVDPGRAYVMGGPAWAMASVLAETFGREVLVPEHSTVANAIGAALSRPTFSAELFADTEQGRMLIPNLEVEEAVDASYGLDQARDDAVRSMRDYLEYLRMDDPEAAVETLEAQSFNMVRGDRLVGRNIRVKCQVRPGLMEAYRKVVQCPC